MFGRTLLMMDSSSMAKLEWELRGIEHQSPSTNAQVHTITVTSASHDQPVSNTQATESHTSVCTAVNRT